MDNTNPAELAQLLNLLRTHRATIAAQWHATIAQTKPTSMDEARPRFSEWTEQIAALVSTEPFAPVQARQIGAELKRLPGIAPADLANTCQTLTLQIANLTGEQWANVRPRLLDLLGELIVGFFSEESETFRQLRLENLTTLGHELRSPLNAISGFSRVILKGIDGPITEPQKQDLTTIYNAGQNLLAFINDILNVTQSDADKSAILPASFQVSALVGDIVTTVQPLVARYERTLELHCANDLGTMATNATHLRWVLLSMLGSAAHFAKPGPQGKVTFRVSREKADNADWIIFSISDNGSGMSLDQAEKLFKGPAPRDTLFTRDYWSSDDLALIANQRICQRLGGDIAVKSESGKGTTFTIRLPANAPTA